MWTSGGETAKEGLGKGREKLGPGVELSNLGERLAGFSRTEPGTTRE